MNKFLAIFSTVISAVILSTAVFYFYPDRTNINVVSPLPDFLTVKKNAQASTLNLWLPSVEESKQSGGPVVSARSALVYDLTTKQTLYSKNPTEKVQMASLTKIMTAVIALENKKEDDRYVVHKTDISSKDESRMGLSEGEVLSLKELLYGLILCSGNDAAETIASNYPKGRDAFIKAMNDKAKSLGLKNTNFCDPSGYCYWGNQSSTPYDLLVLTKYALTLPDFAEVVQTFSYTIPATDTHKEYVLENETNLLTSYPGVKGVKTGYTGKAGLCLVTYLEYDGHKIIGIVLGSENRREDMRQLLDFGLLQQGITPPDHPNA